MTEQTELNLADAVEEKRRRRTKRKGRGQPTDAKPDDAATVVPLPTLYAKAARQASAEEVVEQEASGGTVSDKRRRVIHFTEPYRTRWKGQKRWRQVVTIEPGIKSWIAHTIDEKTGEPDSYEVFGPNVDPATALVEQGQTIVDTHYRQRNQGGWLQGWRRFHGYTIRTSVDLAKFHTGFDIPRVKKPHELRDWLLEQQPLTRAPSKTQAFFRGLRAFVGDFVFPGY